MAVTQPTVAANGFLNFLEFTTIYLNLLEFAVFEKSLMDGRTDLDFTIYLKQELEFQKWKWNLDLKNVIAI